MSSVQVALKHRLPSVVPQDKHEVFNSFLVLLVKMAFTRHRIEAWCEDVAQYLRDGTICHNVTGYEYLETTRSKHSTADLYTNESDTRMSNSQLYTQTTSNQYRSRKMPAEVQDTSLLTAKDLFTSSNDINTRAQFWGIGERIHANPNRVKSAGNRHQEQQRKIEFFVHGLPVESKIALPQEERPPSKALPNADVQNVTVQRKRPVVVVHSRPRSSSQPRYRHCKSHAFYAQTIFGSNGNLLHEFNVSKPFYSSTAVLSGSCDPKILRQGSIADNLYAQRLNTRSQEVYRVIQKY